MPIPIALIAGAALGAGQMAYGASLKRKAQREADANVMPEYQIAPEEAQMLRQAETMAGQGMSDAARESLRANTERSQGSNINAILRGGGNANAISALAGNTQGQLNQMSVYEDQARLQNLRALQEARARMSSNRDKTYQINEYQPWANKAQAISQQLGAATNMQMGGFNTMAQGALGALGTIGSGANRIPTRYTDTPVSMQPVNPMQPVTMQANPQMGYQPGYTPAPQYQPKSQSYLDILNPPVDTPQWNGYAFQ